MKFTCPLCGKEHNLKKGFKDKRCEGKVPTREKEPKKLRGKCIYTIFEKVLRR